MKISSFCVTAFLTSLAACSGANGSGAITPTTPITTSISSATLKITIPTPPPGASASARMRPAYVSYRVQSVVISGTGVNAPNSSVAANVTPTSPGCTGTPTTCSIPIATNVGSSESFTITAYSSTNGTGTVLSSGTVTMPVVAGTSNTIAVPLNPIISFGPISPPSNPATVSHVTAGPNGAIYMMGDHLYVFSPTTQTYSSCEPSIQFNTPIVAGPDGNLWVADNSTPNHIDKVQISGLTCGAISSYPAGSSTGVNAMTVGGDGKIWFATSTEIGTVTTSGTVTNLATADNPPNQMILGGDGNVWFSTSTGEIEKITPAGAITVVASGVNPFSIVLGGDGNIWYSTSSSIGKITPAGATTTYAQTYMILGQGLALGPDGQIWFVNLLGPSEITTTGNVTTYTGWGGFAYSGSVAFGSDGNLYFGASADLDEFVR